MALSLTHWTFYSSIAHHLCDIIIITPQHNVRSAIVCDDPSPPRAVHCHTIFTISF